MALKKIVMTVKWENQKSFQLDAKEDDLTDITIVKVEEDGCIKELWSNVEAICRIYLDKTLKEIGDEMKS
jgi:hypothetical protein